MTKKSEGLKNNKKRDSMKKTILSLFGKNVSKLSKLEQEEFLVLIGQYIGLVDDKGVIK